MRLLPPQCFYQTYNKAEPLSIGIPGRAWNEEFPESDPYLQFSMVAETRAYVRRLIDESLGVENLIQSDFAMLNERLAKHDEIDGVSGSEIRPVVL